MLENTGVAMFSGLGKFKFSRSNIILTFPAHRTPDESVTNSFIERNGRLIPAFYKDGGISRERVFADDFYGKSFSKTVGAIIGKGLRFSDGELDILTKINGKGDDAKIIKLFLAYGNVWNILEDKDNRRIKSKTLKNMSVKIDGMELDKLVDGIHGAFDSIKMLYDNLDKTMTQYFKREVEKYKVFSVRFAPMTALAIDNSHTAGIGVLEVRSMAVNGSVYTRCIPVKYGVSFRVGKYFEEDDYGNPVEVKKIITASLIVAGSNIDTKSLISISDYYAGRNVLKEESLKVLDPEFFVATLIGSSYVVPARLVFSRNNNNEIVMSISFDKKYITGSVPDYATMDVVRSIVLKPNIIDSVEGLNLVPSAVVSNSIRTHFLSMSNTEFAKDFLKFLVLNQREINVKIRTSDFLLVLTSEMGKPKTATPIVEAGNVIGYVETNGMKEYVADFMENPEEVVSHPRTFRYVGIMSVGRPFKAGKVLIFPVLSENPISVDEGYVRFYSLGFVGGRLIIPLKISTKPVDVEVLKEKR